MTREAAACLTLSATALLLADGRWRRACTSTGMLETWIRQRRARRRRGRGQVAVLGRRDTGVLLLCSKQRLDLALAAHMKKTTARSSRDEALATGSEGERR